VKTLLRRALLVATLAAALGATAGPASGAMPAKPVLYGTTGACNNVNPGGPCTQTSTLVQLDAATGALVRVIGPVGFTVNGLAWDTKSGRLYASTAIGDVVFHGLITINVATGAGTPVNAAAHNFGLSGADSPIHSITINGAGRMAAWYDEFGGPTDTFVTIDKATGVATEFNDTGIDTSANGLAYDVFNVLWNIDTRRCTATDPVTGLCTAVGQVAYRIDPKTGKPLGTTAVTPPTMAALGDFNPFTNLYYGLKFNSFSTDPTFVVKIDLATGTATTVGQPVANLHTLAFVKQAK
jgi:hypothetical protein